MQALKPKRNRYEVCDSELAGFQVRVALDGNKTFAVLYDDDLVVGCGTITARN